MGSYHIKIFKNQVLYKHLRTYKSYSKSLEFFKKKVEESNERFFEVQVKNTRPTKYEILLVEEKKLLHETLFKVDEFGRNIKIKTDNNNFTILEVKPYKIEEKVFDLKKNKRITFNEFCNQYLKFKDLKVVYLLNNKIIVQRELNYFLFSCKDTEESMRFLSELSTYCLNNIRRDIMIITDTSVPQKKYIYRELVKIGYDIKMLYRKKTTHQERK